MLLNKKKRKKTYTPKWLRYENLFKYYKIYIVKTTDGFSLVPFIEILI